MERRRLPRYQVSWPVKYTARNQEGVRIYGTGALENVSAAGALVRLDKPLWLGARLDLSIQIPLPKPSWMLYSAEVLRVEACDAGNRVAVEFSPSKPVFSDLE